MDLKQLLNSLSLDEKLGQLFQFHTSLIIKTSADLTGPDTTFGIDKKYIYRAGSVFSFKGADEMIKAQKVYLEHSDKKIPLLFMHNVVNGHKTIYPIPLGMGASFNPELLEECCQMAARESIASGVHVTFAPMLDLVRDARWGRVMESTGEDPYLNSVMAKSFTDGFHISYKGQKMAVCLKHFAAYGAAEAGRDYNLTDMSEHTLRSYYLPAYKASIDAGAEMVMSSFNTVNGIPATANSWLLNDILRDEYGFDGIVISDYNAIGELIAHGYCENEKEAAEKAINCNVDIEMMSATYIKSAKELIAEGKVTEKQIDKMVMRVLKLKKQLGLFNNPYSKASAEDEKMLFCSKKHREIVRRAAEESCVLLKNNGALPLSKEEKIALIGPFSNTGETLGHWRSLGDSNDTVTLYEGISRHTYKRNILMDTACSFIVNDTDDSGFKEAIKKMKRADKVVLAIGEHQMYSGEGRSRANVVLPKNHIRLCEEARKLGKPTVAVVYTGRPLVLEEISELCDSVLLVWQPGTEGGRAIANLLYAKAIPCGKLSMSFPQSATQLPIYYNHLSTGRPKKPGDALPPHPTQMPFTSMYEDVKNEPLYPFGFGLSYSEFRLSSLNLSSNKMTRDEKISVSVELENCGKYDAKEVIQLYLRDKFASVSRPVKELKAFKKVFLKAGEKTRVFFEIDEEMLKFYNDKMQFVSENGEFDLTVSNGINELKQTFELIG